MPLIKGSSQKSFVKNLKSEMESGKPQKQSLAIAYAMKRKAQKKMAGGGMMKYPKDQHEEGVHKQVNTMHPGRSNMGSSVRGGDYDRAKSDALDKLKEQRGMSDKRPLEGLAHGGFLEDEMASGYVDHEGNMVKSNMSAMGEDDKRLNQHMVDMQASTSMAEEDLVDRIMKERSKTFEGLDRYSQGGKIANSEHGMNDEDLAGFSPNEFDDLVLRDDLESSYCDDDNSGDAIGNEQEDMDRKDIVARIMASRRKKDRMPNPA